MYVEKAAETTFVRKTRAYNVDEIDTWSDEVLTKIDTNIVKVQWMPLNVITLGQTESDNINGMITLTDKIYLLIYIKWSLIMWSHLAADNINQCLH